MLPVSSPTLVINEKRMRDNAVKMINKARHNRLEFRPHFKTHQSLYISELFRQQGVTGITVSSVDMAGYFTGNGWNDITIAFPFNIRETERLNALRAEGVEIRILLADTSVLKYLETNLKHKVKACIETDTGQGRSGIPAGNIAEIKQLADAISASKKIEFAGFYTHAGHTYQCRSREEVARTSAAALAKLAVLKKTFNTDICFGDTPSCSVLGEFGPVTQLSPGNFIFYDWMQKEIGSCSEQEIAVALYCPVAAKYPGRRELLIHGGAVHLSKEFLLDENGRPYFGVAAPVTGDGWGESAPGCKVISVSQEHGIIRCTDEFYASVQTGDLVAVLPVHSCLAADLMRYYMTTDGKTIDHMSGRPKPATLKL